MLFIKHKIINVIFQTTIWCKSYLCILFPFDKGDERKKEMTEEWDIEGWKVKANRIKAGVLNN